MASSGFSGLRNCTSGTPDSGGDRDLSLAIGYGHQPHTQQGHPLPRESPPGGGHPAHHRPSCVGGLWSGRQSHTAITPVPLGSPRPGWLQGHMTRAVPGAPRSEGPTRDLVLSRCRPEGA